MIPIGIFAKTFPRPSIEETLDVVVAHGVKHVQFNLSSAGLATLPESIDAPLLARIQTALESRDIVVAALSGTFNIIDPNRTSRDKNLQRLRTLGSVCDLFGTSIITLSTGTRNPEDMWRGHPENGTLKAWKEMLQSIEVALWITEPYNITLVVEPEPGNVVSDADRARALLDEVRSPRLRVLFDAANIIAGKLGDDQQTVLEEAFELLGSDIALAHGKELLGADESVPRVPGLGRLDWDLYLRLLNGSGYGGPLILHGFDEEHASQAIQFVGKQMGGQAAAGVS